MIVCLGWGSLIWNPQELPVKGDWQNDGPVLPVEFLRISRDGRLTLVIDPVSKPLTVLWTELDVSDLSDAIKQLKSREGTTSKQIGRWPCTEKFAYGAEIGRWAFEKKLEGVVWTALGPKFADEDGRRASRDEALQYLRSLSGEKRDRACEYVQRTPQQIDTDYRQAIIANLGWASIE